MYINKIAFGKIVTAFLGLMLLLGCDSVNLKSQCNKIIETANICQKSLVQGGPSSQMFSQLAQSNSNNASTFRRLTLTNPKLKSLQVKFADNQDRMANYNREMIGYFQKIEQLQSDPNNSFLQTEVEKLSQNKQSDNAKLQSIYEEFDQLQEQLRQVCPK